MYLKFLKKSGGLLDIADFETDLKGPLIKQFNNIYTNTMKSQCLIPAEEFKSNGAIKTLSFTHSTDKDYLIAADAF